MTRSPGVGGYEHRRGFPYLCFLAELGCGGLQPVSRAESIPETHSFLEGKRERWG